MQLSRMSVGAVVLLAAVLTGCIVTRDYEGPTSADIAYVDVVSVNGGDLGPIIFDKADDCSGKRYIRRESGRNSAATQEKILRDAFAGSFTRINAGQPTSVGAYLTSQNTGTSVTYCVPIVNFTPQPGRYYRIVLATDDDGCRGSLLSSDTSSFAKSKKERFRRMIFSNGFDENSSFCTAGEYISP